LGDLNDEWKECTQNQIFAHAMGSIDYHTHNLVYVRPGMQPGNARLLSENTNRKCCKWYAAGITNDYHAPTTGGVFEQGGYNWTTVQLS
jgi:hypothetical protein